ncbi:MAG TPA: SpoIID/LytB domain-containing protein [Terracidiphilus sp.]|jgi:stage II sporulation protein D
MTLTATRVTTMLAALTLLSIAGHAQSEVQFGVLGLFHPGTLVLQASSGPAISLAGNSDEVILSNRGRRRETLRADGDRVIVEHTSASAWQAAERDGSPAHFQLSVPGKIVRTYEGKLTVTAHHGELIAVVTMDMETAIASIVAAEMPARAPLEALKAQAVVTRSFLSAGKRHSEFDFCDTTHCQFLRSPDDASRRVFEAVNATRGLVLAYQHKPLAAMYASRCGGQTRTLRDLGMNGADGYPYYSVRCKWCREHPVHWQSRVETTEDAPRSGNEAIRIERARQWGWSAIPGSTFTAEKEEQGLRITGHSIGHGVGLCQFGAIGMASGGADLRAILAHYYPNTELIQSR